MLSTTTRITLHDRAALICRMIKAAERMVNVHIKQYASGRFEYDYEESRIRINTAIIERLEQSYSNILNKLNK